MSHESDVLEFVLFGDPFSLLRMAQVAFEIRQMRMWAHWNHRGFFALSSSSVSSFVVPLPALFFLSFNTWETRGICLACWGICDWRAFWAPKFPLLTSAPPAGFKQTRSHFPSLALHPLTIARPHNSPFGKTPILSLPSGLHRQPGLGCRLSTPKQLFYLCVYAKSLSHVQLFTTLWTIACQAPLSMRFSSKNTGVGCHFLLQGIFLTQGSNLQL